FGLAAVSVNDGYIGLSLSVGPITRRVDLRRLRQPAGAGGGNALIVQRSVRIVVADRHRKVASRILGIDLNLVEKAAAGQIAIGRDGIEVGTGGGNGATENVAAGTVKIRDSQRRAAVGIVNGDVGLNAVDHAIAGAIPGDGDGLSVGTGGADGFIRQTAVGIQRLVVDRGR